MNYEVELVMQCNGDAGMFNIKTDQTIGVKPMPKKVRKVSVTVVEISTIRIHLSILSFSSFVIFSPLFVAIASGSIIFLQMYGKIATNKDTE